MPMYDFHCPSCQHDFEEITPSGGPAPVCPECGAATERMLSAPLVHNRGTQEARSKKGQMWAERHKRNPPKPYSHKK